MAVTITEIQDLIRVQLGRRNVKPEERIVEDMGAESADIVNIIASAEDKYNIIIDEEEIFDIRTVEDLFNLVRNKLEP